MTRYHCPYCLSRYQIHQQRSDGVMVCGQCGDPLVKIPLIKPTQIFALIVAFAFVAPLILIVFSYFHDSNRPQLKKSLSPMAVFPKSIDGYPFI